MITKGIRVPQMFIPTALLLFVSIGSLVSASTNLVIEKDETVNITDGQYDNILVNNGTLIAKGQLTVFNRLRISGGVIYLDGSLDSPKARIDISLGRLVVQRAKAGHRHQAQRLNIGNEGILESSGDWKVERFAVLDRGTLQTPPGKTHQLSLETDSFIVTRGAFVQLSGNCEGFPQPIDGSTLQVTTRELEVNGTLNVKGSNGHSNISAGKGGNVSLRAQSITSFEGYIFAGGGSTWNSTPPGKGGHIEILVNDGSLPNDGRMSVSGGGFSGDFTSRLQDGTINIRRLDRLPVLQINRSTDGIQISFEQPANESFTLRQLHIIEPVDSKLVPIMVTTPSPNPTRIETVVDPETHQTGFFRLVRNPAHE